MDMVVWLMAYEHALGCDTVRVWPAIVTVPLRAAPVLAATFNATLPLPLPFALPVTVIQDALLAALHEQSVAVETAIGPAAPPPTPTETLLGLIEYEQPLPWETVKVCPAIVSVPTRALPVLAATRNATDPGPVPLAPDEMVIHDVLVAAVHEHPLAVVTVTGVPSPPVAGIYWEVEPIAKVQPPACNTVSALSAIAMLPDRAAPVLASTRKLSVPLPLPDAPPVIAIHGTLLDADHVHPEAAVTPTGDPAPPAAPIDCEVESIV
jgi:hypothetical protein